MRWTGIAAVGLALLLAGAAPSSLSAQRAGQAGQDTTSAAQRGLTTDDVVRQIRMSGLSRPELRARLQRLGYDPEMVEPYYDALETGQPVPGDSVAPRQLVTALRDAGVEMWADPGSLMADSAALAAAFEEAQQSRIFGKTLFARTGALFEPLTTGPVPPDYRLGPGDEIWLTLTGDVEASFPLTVGPEGLLIIPDVGQVPVSGLTISQLEDQLYTHLGRVFSGVRRGREATTRFHVSMGRLRTQSVFVVGEAERPSAYAVSSLARVFNALYHAGGPNEIGSFREIHVRRDGERVAVIDLYPYLLAGDASDDIRLEQGDIVFIPTAGPRVKVAGAVRRPGIYELKEGETLGEVIAFAGGLDSDAHVGRIQIDRILPPWEREPGKERALVDIPLERLASLDAEPVPLRGGDSITVFQVRPERRNRVAVTGGVRRSGEYEWTPGMTLEDLIAQAQGLDEGAYRNRVLVYRMQDDRTRRLLRTSLGPGDAARMTLADRDSVVVMRSDSLRLPMTVSIAGYVKHPGDYPAAEGMSVRDLILAAGGFTVGAHVGSAEVARAIAVEDRTGTTAEVLTVPLATALEGGLPRNGVPDWDPAAAEFDLARGDRVYVRRAPGYEPPRTVIVTGEVLMPGEYELGSRGTRISDVISRTGGLTAEAYAPGFTVIRDSVPIAGDLTRALREPGAPADILLQSGDSLHVPMIAATVAVTGAVVFEANVLYQEGRTLADYIEGAGGYTEIADANRVVVTYPNGERQVIDHFLFFKQPPVVEPGSSILVPELPPSERGFNWDLFVSRTTAALTTLATLFLLLERAP